jgi:uncharacterized membrane protein YfcA
VPDPVLLVILIGAAAAGFAQGLSGFAFSMVALSFWAWVIGPQLSAPLAVFGALVGQLAALPFVWGGFNFRRFLPLGIAGLAGVPIGALVLRGLDPNIFRFGLGCLLVVYCPFALFGVRGMRAPRTNWVGDAIAGWFGGILGGISGVAGPIPTLWATICGWSKAEQRGVLQVFNTTMHSATLVAYAATGTLTGSVLTHFVWITPAVVIPALVGVALFNRLDAAAFRRIILSLLFVSGVVLISGSAPSLLS